MLKVYGVCSCGETFDGVALAEAQLAALESRAPEMAQAMRGEAATSLGVCATAWWQEHAAHVPVKARDHHELTLRLESP